MDVSAIVKRYDTFPVWFVYSNCVVSGLAGEGVTIYALPLSVQFTDTDFIRRDNRWSICKYRDYGVVDSSAGRCIGVAIPKSCKCVRGTGRLML